VGLLLGRGGSAFELPKRTSSLSQETGRGPTVFDLGEKNRGGMPTQGRRTPYVKAEWEDSTSSIKGEKKRVGLRR